MMKTLLLSQSQTAKTIGAVLEKDERNLMPCHQVQPTDGEQQRQSLDEASVSDCRIKGAKHTNLVGRRCVSEQISSQRSAAMATSTLWLTLTISGGRRR